MLSPIVSNAYGSETFRLGASPWRNSLPGTPTRLIGPFGRKSASFRIYQSRWTAWPDHVLGRRPYPTGKSKRWFSARLDRCTNGAVGPYIVPNSVAGPLGRMLSRHPAVLAQWNGPCWGGVGCCGWQEPRLRSRSPSRVTTAKLREWISSSWGSSQFFSEHFVCSSHRVS
jgi:hypothetical protein